MLGQIIETANVATDIDNYEFGPKEAKIFRQHYPPGKFMEYSWNIPMRYFQYIQKKFPMKFRGIF